MERASGHDTPTHSPATLAMETVRFASLITMDGGGPIDVVIAVLCSARLCCDEIRGVQHCTASRVVMRNLVWVSVDFVHLASS